MKDATVEAIRLGWRHIDTARAYENEALIGEAIREAVRRGYHRLGRRPVHHRQTLERAQEAARRGPGEGRHAPGARRGEGGPLPEPLALAERPHARLRGRPPQPGRRALHPRAVPGDPGRNRELGRRTFRGETGREGERSEQTAETRRRGRLRPRSRGLASRPASTRLYARPQAGTFSLRGPASFQLPFLPSLPCSGSFPAMRTLLPAVPTGARPCRPKSGFLSGLCGALDPDRLFISATVDSAETADDIVRYGRQQPRKE